MIGLRGRDLEDKDGKLVIKYRRKGGKFIAREIGEPEVRQALKNYLKTAGRKEALKTWGRSGRDTTGQGRAGRRSGPGPSPTI